MANTKVIVIPEGKICDYVDGKFRNDTPEEYVRQTIEKRLVNEHKYLPKQIKIEYTLQMGSRKPRADISNLKELNEMVNYLKASEIYTIEDLESRVSTLRDTVDDLKATMDAETARMKEIRKVPEYLSILRDLKPIVDGLQKIKFDKAKAKYKAEHEKELKQYYAVRRKLLEVCPEGKHDQKLLDKEYAALEKAHAETYAKFKAIREEYQQIHHIHSCVEKGCHAEQTHQKKDHRKQEER